MKTLTARIISNIFDFTTKWIIFAVWLCIHFVYLQFSDRMVKDRLRDPFSYGLKFLAFGSIFELGFCILVSFVQKSREKLNVDEICKNFDDFVKVDLRPREKSNAKFIFMALIVFLLAMALVFDETSIRWRFLAFPTLVIAFKVVDYSEVFKKIEVRLKYIKKLIKPLILSRKEFRTFILECKVFECDFNHKDKELDNKIAVLMRMHNVLSSAGQELKGLVGVTAVFIVLVAFVNIAYGGFRFFVELELTRDVNTIVGKKFF